MNLAFPFAVLFAGRLATVSLAFGIGLIGPANDSPAGAAGGSSTAGPAARLDGHRIISLTSNAVTVSTGGSDRMR